MPPPVPFSETFARFPETVIRVASSFPPPTISIPPPSVAARLSETVASFRVSVPATKIAPPVPALVPFVAVRSRIVAATPPFTAKTGPVSLASTESWLAPGPAISTASVRFGSGLARVIVPVAVMVIVSGPPAALASVIACRSVPGPVSSVELTVNTAACALPTANSDAIATAATASLPLSERTSSPSGCESFGAHAATPCRGGSTPSSARANRDLAAEPERRYELDPVAAPEASGVVPTRRPVGRQKAHALVGRGHELRAVDRLERRRLAAPEAARRPAARQAERRGERPAVVVGDRLHQAILVVAVDLAALEQAHPGALAVALVPGRHGVAQLVELHAALALAGPHIGQRAPELSVPQERREVV